MNTDEHRYKKSSALSVFICVHLWTILIHDTRWYRTSHPTADRPADLQGHRDRVQIHPAAAESKSSGDKWHRARPRVFDVGVVQRCDDRGDARMVRGGG